MIFSKKTSNKIDYIILTMLFSGGIFTAEKVFALNGREIMEKVNAREVGDRSSSEIEMILIDKKGKKRIRKLKTFGSKKGQDEFVRIAQKWVKGLGPVRANKLWGDSEGPLDALDAISKKQIIDNLFPHKTTPNMRYKVNKKF